MERYFYDLHIHSCLSPCAEMEMTPPNIANMAALLGLQLVAVTDHNSARNVRAVIEAAADLPLTVIPGIELTTAEEIHIVCLFPDADAAEAAGAAAEAALPPFPNDEQVFGIQQVMTADETPVSRVERLLINATDISVDNVKAFAARYGGFCYPAHIDKAANSILATFGELPDYLGFGTVEVAHPDRFAPNPAAAGILKRYRCVTSSDAHMLTALGEAERFLELPAPDFASLRALLDTPR